MNISMRLLDDAIIGGSILEEEEVEDCFGSRGFSVFTPS